MKRKVYRIDKAGSIEKLQIVEEVTPSPKVGEVTVEVRAIGLNFADIFAIQGLYSATPKGSFVPGLEYSGIVINTGSKDSEFKTGDEVMGVIRFGAYASHLTIDEKYLTPLPAGWSFEEGAAYPVQVLTAYYALKNLGNVQPEYNVLIHSAAGGVGLWANRIAKKFNCFTIGTVGNEAKVDFCLKEGYDKVIVRSENFKQDLKQKLEDRPLNLVLDSIGGKIFKDSYVLMAPEGRVIVYGSARYTTKGAKPNFLKLFLKYIKRPKVDPQSMINYNKAVMGFNLIYLYNNANLMKQMLIELASLNLDKPHVGEKFSFDQLKDALYHFQSGKTIGKVVIQNS